MRLRYGMTGIFMAMHDKAEAEGDGELEAGKWGSGEGQRWCW